MPVLKNARHERFIQGVVKGISPGPAYTAAGYEVTGNSAESAAARLFRNGQVKERYAELMAPAIEATGATVERVLKEMVRLAFYDMTEILAVDDDGKVTQRDPTSLPEDLRRAIVGIKPFQVGEEHHYECKFADKQKALDSLARYLQMFKNTLVVENVFRVVQEMDDYELDRRLAELERAYSDAKTLDPPTGEGPARLH